MGPPQGFTNDTGGHGLRLLMLSSGRDMDWMFCDLGVVEFWIDAQDLSARRWDRAHAMTAGG